MTLLLTGHSIRTSLIPEAVLWYTGEAIEDDDEDDEVRYCLFYVCVCLSLSEPY